MANKTMMVAKREYLENVRTKTFWLGILMFPILFSLFIFVPALLKKTKDVQKYSVVDNSQGSWFSAAFDSATKLPDLQPIFDDWKKGALPAEPALPEALEVMFAKTDEAASKFANDPKKAQELVGATFGQLKAFVSLTPAELEQFEQLSSMIPDALMKNLTKSAPQLEGQSLAQVAVKSSRAIFDVASTWWTALAESEDPAIKSTAARYLSTKVKGKYLRVDAVAEDEMRKKIDAGDLYGFFVIPEDPVGKRENGDKAAADKADRELFKFVTSQEHLADTELRDWFKRTSKEIVRKRRISKLKIADKDASWLGADLRFTTKKLGEGGEEAKVEKADVLGQWAPVGFVYLLWISIFSIANLLLTNTIEEKSNRLIEVLLSSVSPLQLMMGKILGLAGTGLTMVLSWGIFTIIGIKLLPLFGQEIAGKVAEAGVTGIITNPRYVASFLIYFLFGYLFYAAILVGIGSVCNSLKEAQNLMQPVMLILFVPLLAMIPIAQSPNGTLAKVMSYIPPFTPFVMMNRAGGPPTMFEYTVTTVILLAAVVVAIVFAAKIFRIGVLMTGKPPKIREMFGWLKAPVGSVYVREDEIEEK